MNDKLLDRLVDGELPDAEYRAAVEQFEADPDGWRRCALAFLEAQALRRELGFLRADREAPATPASWARSSWSWQLGGLITLASAASFALAFALSAHLLQRPLGNRSERLDTVAIDSDRANSATAPPQPARTPWGEYRLVVHGEDGQPRQVQLPIFAHDDPRARSLFDDRETMPIELIRTLQQMGFEVDRQRKWAPVFENPDEPVLVPIEELKITPVTSRSYR
jgi:hypothetical protein